MLKSSEEKINSVKSLVAKPAVGLKLLSDSFGCIENKRLGEQTYLKLCVGSLKTVLLYSRLMEFQNRLVLLQTLSMPELA